MDKPSVVADIGLRLSEGIQDLKLEQQLAPAREAATRAIAVGSTNFFKAVEGVRGRWAQRSASQIDDPTPHSARPITPPIEVSKSDIEDTPKTARQAEFGAKTAGLRPFSLASVQSLSFMSPPASPGAPAAASPMGQQISSWSAGLGSFFGSKAGRFSAAIKTPTTARPADVGGSETGVSSHRQSGSMSAGIIAESGKVTDMNEDYGEPQGSPLFNGMSPETSPGVSPTAEKMAVPSIASVLQVKKVELSTSSAPPKASVDEHEGYIGVAQ